MIYEFKIAVKTIRQEGIRALLWKIGRYFRQMANAVRFSLMRKPHGDAAEKVVDFTLNAADGLIRPGQARSEFVQLVALLQKRRPRVVVEIGTATGGTLAAWCAAADPRATIVSIDLPGGVHGGGYAYWRTAIYKQFAKPQQTLHLLRADSHQAATLQRLKLLLPPGGIDFLFIDGDHTYAGVKADFEMYSPLVRTGGLIALHDICVHAPEMDCHVDEFWRDIRAGYKSREFIENPHQGFFGVGLIEW